MRSYKASRRAHDHGMTIMELMDMFLTEQAATEWFEYVLWGNERCSGHCGSANTREVPKRKPMPDWCTDDREHMAIPAREPAASIHPDVGYDLRNIEP